MKAKKIHLRGCTISPITISTPFAVGDVHCYLIRDDKNVLVDCGPRTDTSYRQLTQALHREGVLLETIDEIWLTHGHPDHFGQAATIARRSGAVVKGHPKERMHFSSKSNHMKMAAFFETLGIPDTLIAAMARQFEFLQEFQEPIEPEWIADDGVLSSGTLTFNVQHLPGHAPGHVAFYIPGELALAGDVLLKHISTNALISFDADTGRRNLSLPAYRRSLRWMQRQHGLIVLPGHGPRIADPGALAATHRAAQEQRLARITGLLAQPHTLYQLCEILFADALQRGEYFLVISEVMGYLDWGMEEGRICEIKEGKGTSFQAV